MADLMRWGKNETGSAEDCQRRPRVVPALALRVILCDGTTTPTPVSQAEAYVSRSLNTSYEGALSASNQLILGTLLLEGTADAITPEQDRVLLPLWQALQQGAPQGQMEVNIVLSQIEWAMTPAQLSAIAAMRLTQNSMATWVQGHGGGLPQQPASPGGIPDLGGRGDFSSQARQTRPADFHSTSEEEHSQRTATAQAGGMPSGRRAGRSGSHRASSGQSFLLQRTLLEVLTQRAG